MLVYENGNLQAMELRDGAWTCDLGEGATAAYGFTPAGELVYLPSSALQNGKANIFQRWDGAVETPDALLRKLFAQQP
jgi:hypothetical protein